MCFHVGAKVSNRAISAWAAVEFTVVPIDFYFLCQGVSRGHIGQGGVEQSVGIDGHVYLVG